jgi:hypothetical protein
MSHLRSSNLPCCIIMPCKFFVDTCHRSIAAVYSQSRMTRSKAEKEKHNAGCHGDRYVYDGR